MEAIVKGDYHTSNGFLSVIQDANGYFIKIPDIIKNGIFSKIEDEKVLQNFLHQCFKEKFPDDCRTTVFFGKFPYCESASQVMRLMNYALEVYNKSLNIVGKYLISKSKSLNIREKKKKNSWGCFIVIREIEELGIFSLLPSAKPIGLYLHECYQELFPKKDNYKATIGDLFPFCTSPEQVTMLMDYAVGKFIRVYRGTATQKQLDEYYTKEDKREAKEYKEEEERKSKEKEEKEGVVKLNLLGKEFYILNCGTSCYFLSILDIFSANIYEGLSLSDIKNMLAEKFKLFSGTSSAQDGFPTCSSVRQLKDFVSYLNEHNDSCQSYEVSTVVFHGKVHTIHNRDKDAWIIKMTDIQNSQIYPAYMDLHELSIFLHKQYRKCFGKTTVGAFPECKTKNELLLFINYLNKQDYETIHQKKEVEKIVDDCFSQLEHQDLVTKTVKTKAENTIIWMAHCNKEFPLSISNDIIQKIRKHAFYFVLFRGNFTVKVKV